MARQIRYLDATTKAGRQALFEVMKHSYDTDWDCVPAEWALVRLADGVPVSFALVDPDRQMDFPCNPLRYGFVLDVATREDRRREGHFRGMLEETFARLRAASVPAAILHGAAHLYRRFDFCVFTHHSGVLATPERIERFLGSAVPAGARDLLVFDSPKHFHREDLLIIIDIKSAGLSESRAALLAAAAVAREGGKPRIFFEHPAAPSYGSHYPMYASPETPFTRLALACGAEVRLQGSDPEGGAIPHADWIKVLDAAAFLRAVLPSALEPGRALPRATVCLDTAAGLVTLQSTAEEVAVSGEPPAGVTSIPWPAAALAQLVTGYRSVEVLCALYDAPLPGEAMNLLGELFPPCWRFSRNESWLFKT